MCSSKMKTLLFRALSPRRTSPNGKREVKEGLKGIKAYNESYRMKQSSLQVEPTTEEKMCVSTISCKSTAHFIRFPLSKVEQSHIMNQTILYLFLAYMKH
jgi:hypothetical protein